MKRIILQLGYLKLIVFVWSLIQQKILRYHFNTEVGKVSAAYGSENQGELVIRYFSIDQSV